MLPSRRFLAAFLAALICAAAAAQVRTPSAPSGGGSGAKTAYKPGNAWTLEYPLGSHVAAPMDTLTYNYQRQAVPSLVSDAFATTGNLGAEGQNQIFFDRAGYSKFFFNDALSAYLPTAAKQKFYNVYIPMTLASYNFGGGRDSQQDRLRAVFAGNVNRRIGIGADIDYLYSKGSYADQAVKKLSFGFNGYYRGDRYEMQAFYNHWNSLNKENGGITDDLYITDPAELQGGVSSIQPKNIPTNLSSAHSRVWGTEFFMNHAYNVGYWKDVEVNDTLTRQEYVPVLKFIYSLDYQDGNHLFLSTNTANRDFWQHTYYDPLETHDNTKFWSLNNTVGISMVEGFRKWVKFGLSAYASYEFRKFSQKIYDPEVGETELELLTPVLEEVADVSSQNLMWIGGRLDKRSGSLLNYTADAKFGVLGGVAGDIDLSGRVGTNFKLFGDTVSIQARAHFKNTTVPYLLKNYRSNHFVWRNNFGQTRSLRVGGELTIPWTRTKIYAGFENLQNYVYFDLDCLPRQCGSSIRIFTARLEQDFRFGIWNWRNRLTLQTSSNQEVLPLPTLSIYSNMYLAFKAFRILDLQIGVDCDFYTRYRGVNYQPATMSFFVGEDWSIGGYPFCNAYITAKLYKVRFFLMMSNVGQGLLGHNYFSMPHYPLNPRRFQLGLSVDFAN